MSGERPPILKSSIRSWNCPWTSPHTVTGHFTSCTLDSFDSISLALEAKQRIVSKTLSFACRISSYNIKLWYTTCSLVNNNWVKSFTTILPGDSISGLCHDVTRFLVIGFDNENQWQLNLVLHRVIFKWPWKNQNQRQYTNQSAWSSKQGNAIFCTYLHLLIITSVNYPMESWL